MTRLTAVIKTPPKLSSRQGAGDFNTQIAAMENMINRGVKVIVQEFGSLAAEWAKSGVRVNAITPGQVKTEHSGYTLW